MRRPSSDPGHHVTVDPQVASTSALNSAVSDYWTAHAIGDRPSLEALHRVLAELCDLPVFSPGVQVSVPAGPDGQPVTAQMLLLHVPLTSEVSVACEIDPARGERILYDLPEGSRATWWDIALAVVEMVNDAVDEARRALS